MSTTTTTKTAKVGKKVTRQAREKAAAYKVVSLMAQNGTTFIIFEGDTFVIQGKRTLSVSTDTRTLLLTEGWLTERVYEMITIGQLTFAGQAVAARLAKVNQRYRQINLWVPDEEEEEIEEDV